MSVADVITLGFAVATLVLAVVSVRFRYRATEAALRRAAAYADRADLLQTVVDKAWDAALEFDDDPGIALGVVCAWLEPAVTVEEPTPILPDPTEPMTDV